MAPLRTRNKRRSNNNTKWLSAEAVKVKRLRRRLDKRWITRGHNDDSAAYRQACRKANRLINESRRSYHREMIHGCIDSTKRWAAIKKILYSSKRDIEDLDENNKKRCQSFADYFCSKITCIRQTISARLQSLTIITFLILPMLTLYSVN